MAFFNNTNTSKTVVIGDYKPFYIQKTYKTDESTTYTTYDTKTQFGMIAKSNPYPLLPNPKEVYKNEWKDQDGDDEYTGSIHYEAFEIEVQFYIKTIKNSGTTAVALLHTWAKDFFDFVKEGEMEIYDAYTDLGFRKVRYAGYTEDSFKARGDWASAVITVKFKVNDPITRMKRKSNGRIEPIWYL